MSRSIKRDIVAGWFVGASLVLMAALIVGSIVTVLVSVSLSTRSLGSGSLVDYLIVVGAVGALILYRVGIRAVARASTRWHGLAVESGAVARAAAAARRYGVHAVHGRFFQGIGDVDLVVTRGPVETGAMPRRDASVAVEIKSFVKFSRSDERYARAARQARRCGDAMRTRHCIVWAPHAEPTLWQWLFGVRVQGVPVVLGGARAMIRQSRRMLEG